ncbi:hypothetical protein ABZT49_05940 [Methylobacterium sp. EM32]|uniref:hypothetical protein n=1 Tax=unclassified Methylobacterium TaxID=2615210 RepID=UPI0008DEB77D|nr:hypothetical protein [Methylobacterium sp. 174MFSha1.1]SFU92680.1 hypothetical protein SAMN02799631_03178 [Methylobacterium sp. 174MFSha1.1]
MSTKVHVLKRALARREREEVYAAFALSIAGGKAILFHAQPVEVVDRAWKPIPGTGLDLVIRAATSDDAYDAWTRHAEDVGAVGTHRVMLTYIQPATEERPAREMESLKDIDLDKLALMDELGDLYDEDVALGTAIPGAF